MSHTLKTIIWEKDEAIRLDFTHMEGYQAFLAELEIRYLQGKKEITQSFFRRVCKRHLIGMHDTVTELYLTGVVVSFTMYFPKKVHISLPVYKTYEQWRKIGWQVNRDEHSHARGLDTDTAYFASYQVIPRQQ